MEIHAPHKPILSLREALVHLVIVTVGILIALSLEGVRQWVEHRSLAAEARENITREIRDNAKELNGFVKGIPRLDANLEHAREVLERIVPGKELKGESVSLTYSLATLSTASRATAEVTGAFGYMPYDEVKKYAEVYDLQGKFVKMQDDTMTAYTTALGASTIFGESATATPEAIASLRRMIDGLRASLLVQQQFGDKLAKSYAEIARAEH
jgi:hypothetical protein